MRRGAGTQCARRAVHRTDLLCHGRVGRRSPALARRAVHRPSPGVGKRPALPCASVGAPLRRLPAHARSRGSAPTGPRGAKAAAMRRARHSGRSRPRSPRRRRSQRSAHHDECWDLFRGGLGASAPRRRRAAGGAARGGCGWARARARTRCATHLPRNSRPAWHSAAPARTAPSGAFAGVGKLEAVSCDRAGVHQVPGPPGPRAEEGQNAPPARRAAAMRRARHSGRSRPRSPARRRSQRSAHHDECWDRFRAGVRAFRKKCGPSACHGAAACGAPSRGTRGAMTKKSIARAHPLGARAARHQSGTHEGSACSCALGRLMALLGRPRPLCFGWPLPVPCLHVGRFGGKNSGRGRLPGYQEMASRTEAIVCGFFFYGRTLQWRGDTQYVCSFRL